MKKKRIQKLKDKKNQLGSGTPAFQPSQELYTPSPRTKSRTAWRPSISSSDPPQPPIKGK